MSFLFFPVGVKFAFQDLSFFSFLFSVVSLAVVCFPGKKFPLTGGGERSKRRELE